MIPVWITKNRGAIRLCQMTTKHIITAFLSICNREYATFIRVNREQAILDAEREALDRKQTELNKLYKELNTFQKLKKDLQEEAERRGESVVYPDQVTSSSQYGPYFEAERKTKALVVASV